MVRVWTFARSPLGVQTRQARPCGRGQLRMFGRDGATLFLGFDVAQSLSQLPPVTGELL